MRTAFLLASFILADRCGPAAAPDAGIPVASDGGVPELDAGPVDPVVTPGALTVPSSGTTLSISIGALDGTIAIARTFEREVLSEEGELLFFDSDGTQLAPPRTIFPRSR